jgi:hypothetical protein
MRLWWRRKRAIVDAASELRAHQAESAHPPVSTAVPERVLEEAPLPDVKQKAYATWIDQMIAEHEQKGGFRDLEGKGKPLNINENDGDYMMNRIMKNANILPPWLELGHEIRDEIEALHLALKRNPNLDPNKRLQSINAKIAKYNAECPSPLLQKAPIRLETIEEQLQAWQ